ncbi:MAG TPA: nucleoside monophosphate kinase [Acidimicrobiales bacterium]|nr:nucleoside monophosphate kinase [Acidimicrobiales bacterium]
MRIVLLGPPGCGKGTQGTELAARLAVPYLSSGEVLRAEAEAGTELGREIVPYLERGELVPEDLTHRALHRALADARAAGGYVLDGYPRTVDQARTLDDGVIAVLLDLPDAVARARIAGRAEGRADDTDRGVIDRRLWVYHAQTAPLLDVFRTRGTLVTVDADQPRDAVAAAIDAALAGRRR